MSNTGDFEFSLLLGEIKYHLVSYPKIGDGGKVWFSGKLDKDTGKILSIKIGGITTQNILTGSDDDTHHHHHHHKGR